MRFVGAGFITSGWLIGHSSIWPSSWNAAWHDAAAGVDTDPIRYCRLSLEPVGTGSLLGSLLLAAPAATLHAATFMPLNVARQTDDLYAYKTCVYSFVVAYA